VHVRTKAR